LLESVLAKKYQGQKFLLLLNCLLKFIPPLDVI